MPQFLQLYTRDSKSVRAAENELLRIKGTAQVAINVSHNDDGNGDGDDHDLISASHQPHEMGTTGPLCTDAKYGSG